MSRNINPFEEHGLSGADANISVDLSLSSNKAWVKMGTSALAGSYDWILCLIEAAILNEAKTIKVRLSHKWDNALGMYHEKIKIFDSAKSFVSMICITFDSRPFDNLISRLPFCLLAEGESLSEKVFHNIAMGMAGAIGYGAKLLDFSFYTGNYKGQRVVLDANDKDVTLVYQKEEEMLESSWYVCLDANNTENKITGAFNHCLRRVSLMTERSIFNIGQSIKILPKAPPNYPNFFTTIIEDYNQKVLFSAPFNDHPFFGYCAILKEKVNSSIYLTRNRIHLTAINYTNLPWKVPAEIAVEHPGFRTDISRKNIDPQCKSYNKMIDELGVWQEEALYKYFAGVLTWRFDGVRFSYSDEGYTRERIFFYRFLRNNAENIKKWFLNISDIQQDTENKTLMHWLLTTPMYYTISKKKLQKLSFLEKVQLYQVDYTKYSLLDLYKFTQYGEIFISSNAIGDLWKKLPNEDYIYVMEHSTFFHALYYALKSLFPQKVYPLE